MSLSSEEEVEEQKEEEEDDVQNTIKANEGHQTSE